MLLAHALALVTLVGFSDHGLCSPAQEIQDTLPEYFPKRICRRDDRDGLIGSCIRHNFQALVPAIKDGGRLGLPSLDPYVVQQVNVDLRYGPVQFQLGMSNMTVHGLTDVVVKDARADLRDDSMNLDVDLFFPLMSFRGLFKYKNAIFDQLAYNGYGPFEFNFTDVSATWTLQGKRQFPGKYMIVQQVTPNYTVGKMTFWGQDLVEGKPKLDDVIINLINRLEAEIVAVNKPFVQRPLSGHIRQLADSVFRSVPYDLLFPKGEK